MIFLIYNLHLQIFENDKIENVILQKLTIKFKPLHVLWKLSMEWFENSSTWFDPSFLQIKVDQKSTFVNQTLQKIIKLKIDLKNHRILISNVLTPIEVQIEKLH
jgi:hypothetical protein